MERKISLALLLTIVVSIGFTSNVFAETLSQRVNAASDDAEEIDDGTVLLYDGDLELCEDDDPLEVGLRFNNIVIPEGSTITNAYIEFTVQEVEGGTSNVTIFGEDTDHAITFNSSDFNVSSRTKTSASVPWFLENWNTVGETHQTPDITAVVQEIVNRTGWSNGNSMAFVFTGTGEQVAESYDGSASAAPLLVIEFSAPAPPQLNKTVSADTAVAGNTVTYTFEIVNTWTTALTNIVFRDTLNNGLTWASEPINLSGGITIGITGISGNSIGTFTISNIPVGTSGFDIQVAIPGSYSGGTPYMNQAWLTELPALLGSSKPSDYPVTPAIDDPTPLVILSQTDCIGNWNIPSLSVDFAYNHLSVDAFASRPLVNVVLEFHDGAHQMFSGLSGNSGTFSGTGANDEKCITGIWIRTACNASGDGPEYGEYVVSPIWDGLCFDYGPPVIQISFDHESPVISNGPTTPTVILDVLTEYIATVTSGGHNTTINGITRPDVPGQDEDREEEEDDDDEHTNDEPGYGVDIDLEDLGLRDLGEDELLQTEVSVWPNPVRAHGYLNVRGLDDNSWNYHVYSINGSQLASGQVINERELDISQIQLKPGIYILQFENGTASTSEKIIVQ